MGLRPVYVAAQQRPAAIPAGYVQVSPCVPGMGEHWANPATFHKGGTIYGTYQAKPVFSEIMVTQRDFASGKSWEDTLAPLPGYRIDHVDIEFMPHGHPGMTYAHYDIHGYYVSHARHRLFCRGASSQAAH
ncbi:MAG: hypothetical protein GIW99_03820 [Candidatus Eremiobacteraeota bacterium]|nr:hypothetical protein [Candidatus Eremiobacteraeota bacterium]MBC5826800.1 hypothetical protein [Candidatus Eremiobacteraeota bacterium]